MALDIICQAKASYKKVSGTLTLTNTHMQWARDGEQSPILKVPHSQASCLFYLAELYYFC